MLFWWRSRFWSKSHPTYVRWFWLVNTVQSSFAFVPFVPFILHLLFHFLLVLLFCAAAIFLLLSLHLFLVKCETSFHDQKIFTKRLLGLVANMKAALQQLMLLRCNHVNAMIWCIFIGRSDVVHMHRNKNLVHGGRVEDHITNCALKDVYELHMNSQQPAVQCQTLSSSSNSVIRHYFSYIDDIVIFFFHHHQNNGNVPQVLESIYCSWRRKNMCHCQATCLFEVYLCSLHVIYQESNRCLELVAE